jgi:hypothetical protein
MASFMEVVPVAQASPDHVSMEDLAVRTASGSLPMYLFFIAYHNSPYVITLLLIVALVVFLATYYRMMKPRKSAETKELLGDLR